MKSRTTFLLLATALLAAAPAFAEPAAKAKAADAAAALDPADDLNDLHKRHPLFQRERPLSIVSGARFRNNVLREQINKTVMKRASNELQNRLQETIARIAELGETLDKHALELKAVPRDLGHHDPGKARKRAAKAVEASRNARFEIAAIEVETEPWGAELDAIQALYPYARERFVRLSIGIAIRNLRRAVVELEKGVRLAEEALAFEGEDIPPPSGPTYIERLTRLREETNPFVADLLKAMDEASGANKDELDDLSKFILFTWPESLDTLELG